MALDVALHPNSCFLSSLCWSRNHCLDAKSLPGTHDTAAGTTGVILEAMKERLKCYQGNESKVRCSPCGRWRRDSSLKCLAYEHMRNIWSCNWSIIPELRARAEDSSQRKFGLFIQGTSSIGQHSGPFQTQEIFCISMEEGILHQLIMVKRLQTLFFNILPPGISVGC